MSDISGLGWYAGYNAEGSAASTTGGNSASSSISPFTDQLAGAIADAIAGAKTGTKIEIDVTAPGHYAFSVSDPTATGEVGGGIADSRANANILSSAALSVVRPASSQLFVPTANDSIAVTTPLGLATTVYTVDAYLRTQVVQAQNVLLGDTGAYSGQTEQQIVDGLRQSAHAYVDAYPQSVNGEDVATLAANYGAAIFSASQDAQAAAFIPRSDPAFQLLPGQSEGRDTFHAALRLYQQEKAPGAS